MKDQSATQSLRDLIVAEIRQGGALPLPRYIELALYHPQWGYYARGDRRVGREGDFFTSVSVGPLFGRLLARRLIAIHRELGCPADWRVVEFGANDGRLAVDILRGLRELDGAAAASLDYVIREPLPKMREIQQRAVRGLGARMLDPSDGMGGAPLPGVVFGNEVLDALPFHWVEWREGRWRERAIALGDGGKLEAVVAGEAPPEVRDLLGEALSGIDLPEGWQGEVRTGWQEFFANACEGMRDPRMIWIDYGFDRDDLWHPARKEGSWRAYRDHRPEPDPWDAPGECDLTGHVDFTAVGEAVAALGGKVCTRESQGSWLTRLAVDELAEREGTEDTGWVRQFQMLTHPAQLGGKFQVMECGW